MIQLKVTELKELRLKWHTEQEFVCPILKLYFPVEDMVIDHAHGNKVQDETSKLCRGCINRQVNAFEGKITNNYKRLGLEKYIDLPTVLRNLADYLENNKAHTDEKYIHPSEKIKEPKLSKRNYNLLKKEYLKTGRRAKFPEYPKTGKITKKLKEMFTEFNISPYN